MGRILDKIHNIFLIIWKFLPYAVTAYVVIVLAVNIFSIIKKKKEEKTKFKFGDFSLACYNTIRMIGGHIQLFVNGMFFLFKDAKLEEMEVRRDGKENNMGASSDLSDKKGD